MWFLDLVVVFPFPNMCIIKDKPKFFKPQISYTPKAHKQIVKT
jgi:hypothetical protein